ASLPFAKLVAAWPKPLDDGDREALKGEVRPINPVKNEFGPTLADQMEVFFKQTDIPVVAEVFRSTVYMGSPDKVSVPDWLSRVSAGHRTEAKFTEGVVELRYGGFWRRRRFEIPEK